MFARTARTRTVVSFDNIRRLYFDAHQQVKGMAMTNVMAGFMNTVIYPFNSDLLLLSSKSPVPSQNILNYSTFSPLLSLYIQSQDSSLSRCCGNLSISIFVRFQVLATVLYHGTMVSC